MRNAKFLSIFIIFLLSINYSFSSNTKVIIDDNVYTIVESKLLDSLETHNKVLQSKIDNANCRIDDVYKCLQIIVVLLVALLIGSGVSSYFVAKKEALKELSDLEIQISSLKDKASTISDALETYKKGIEDLVELKKGSTHGK